MFLHCHTEQTMLFLSLPKTDISVIILIASLYWYQFKLIFFNTVDWNCINISHKILPVPCLKVPIFPSLLKISPEPSEHYIICFHSCVVLAALAHWQSIRTHRSFSFSCFQLTSPQNMTLQFTLLNFYHCRQEGHLIPGWWSGPSQYWQYLPALYHMQTFRGWAWSLYLIHGSIH